MTGLSPLFDSQTRLYRKNSVAELTQDLFDPANMMCDCNPRAGRYLTFAAIYRGAVSMKEIDEQVQEIQNKNSSLFVEWIPHNAKVSSCSVAPKGHKLTATFLANNTALQDVMRRIRDQFYRMYKRKAFVHWYTSEGVEEIQFMEVSKSTLIVLQAVLKISWFSQIKKLVSRSIIKLPQKSFNYVLNREKKYNCLYSLYLQAESNLLDLISEYEQFTFMTLEDELACCCDEFEDSLEELDSGIG